MVWRNNYSNLESVAGIFRLEDTRLVVRDKMNKFALQIHSSQKHRKNGGAYEKKIESVP